MSFRPRQVPHVEGNFSTLIFVDLLPANRDALEKFLGFCIQELERHGQRFGKSLSLAELVPPHLSLSRNVYLKPHLIEPFLAAMHAAVSSITATSLFLWDRLHFYLNESGDSCFAAIPVDLSLSPHILDIIRRVDLVMGEFDLPLFYKNPSPHVSLVCGVGREGERFASSMQTEGPRLPLAEPQDLDELRVDVSEVRVRIGKEVDRIFLS